MLDSRVKSITEIGDKLFSGKLPWDQLCQELAEHFHPMRSDFTSPFTLGDDFATGLMDSFSVQARETLSNMPNAVLRQGNWFSIKTGDDETDEQPQIARFFEAATERLRKLVYQRKAKFVKATVESDHDWVAFGNNVLSVEENSTRSNLLYRAWHPRDCAWMENGDGDVDHLQRNMPMTARNMVRRWPGKCHADIVQASTQDPTKVFKVRHVVMPADEIYGDDRKKRKLNSDMPFLSLYIDKDHCTLLGEGRLPAFNYIIGRWRTVTSCLQGFSPASIAALPDSRMLQALARIILEQGEKAVDPPMIGKGEIFRDAVNLYAGGMTYVDMPDDDDINKVFRVLDQKSNLVAGLEIKQDVRNLIAEAFLLNKLMLPPLKDMTAFETEARLAEYRRAALPFFGPIESEYHLPLLDISFEIAKRGGLFRGLEMPDELGDREVTFSFESPLNTAEGRRLVAAYQESVQILAGASQFDQTAPSLIDFKQATKDAIRGTGAPADWFNDDETQESQEEAAGNVAALGNAATALREGAGVATDVATATTALKQAGLV